MSQRTGRHDISEERRGCFWTILKAGRVSTGSVSSEVEGAVVFGQSWKLEWWLSKGSVSCGVGRRDQVWIIDGCVTSSWFPRQPINEMLTSTSWLFCIMHCYHGYQGKQASESTYSQVPTHIPHKYIYVTPSIHWLTALCLTSCHHIKHLCVPIYQFILSCHAEHITLGNWSIDCVRVNIHRTHTDYTRYLGNGTWDRLIRTPLPGGDV